MSSTYVGILTVACMIIHGAQLMTRAMFCDGEDSSVCHQGVQKDSETLSPWSAEIIYGLPCGSKDPNNGALGPKYHLCYSNRALNPIFEVLGPLGLGCRFEEPWMNRQRRCPIVQVLPTPLQDTPTGLTMPT